MTLNPAFPGYNLESCFVHTHNIFAIWWNKSLDNQNFTKKAAEDMGTELEKMRENLNKNYSLKVRKFEFNSVKFFFPLGSSKSKLWILLQCLSLSWEWQRCRNVHRILPRWWIKTYAFHCTWWSLLGKIDSFNNFSI